MNPGDASWWWTVALDGIVSGVIGGGVTALAVWLTLKADRERQEAIELRTAAAQLLTAAMRVIAANTSSNAKLVSRAIELFSAASVVESLAARRARRLSSDMSDGGDVLTVAIPWVQEGEESLRAAITAVAAQMYGCAHAWLGNAEGYATDRTRGTVTWPDVTAFAHD